MTSGPRSPHQEPKWIRFDSTRMPKPLDLRAVEENAAILDDPQLKRLGGVILSLDLAYVAAVQNAPEHMRALLVHCRALRAALREAKKTHLVVEDCWYSCPQALDDEGDSECCNDAISDGPCNCGADDRNHKIDAVLAQAVDSDV